jgi:hypothetical protein
VVIEELSFPMNVEPSLLNYDCMEGWNFRRILHLPPQFRQQEILPQCQNTVGAACALDYMLELGLPGRRAVLMI